MDTLDVMRICVKRWYVFVPIVLLAYFASQSLSSQRHPVYSATGTFAVIYKPSVPLKPGQVDPRQMNPLAEGGGALLKQALLADLRSPATQRQLASPGVTGTSPSAPSDGSLFAVTSTATTATVGVATYGPDRAAVSATVNRVLAASSAKAQQLQDRAGAPAAGRLGTFVTLPTQSSELAPQSAIKLVVAIMAIGVIAGAGLSLLLDRLLTKRRARKEAAGARRGTSWRTRRPARRHVAQAPESSPREVEVRPSEADLADPRVMGSHGVPGQEQPGSVNDDSVSELAASGHASVGPEDAG